MVGREKEIKNDFSYFCLGIKNSTNVWMFVQKLFWCTICGACCESVLTEVYLFIYFLREIKFSYILAYQILGKKNKKLILCASTNA